MKSHIDAASVTWGRYVEIHIHTQHNHDSDEQCTMKLNRKLFQFIRSKFWPGGVRFTIISWACDRTYFNRL